jgi:Ser/Thr protein kinase RdoA (MazF antagonist)
MAVRVRARGVRPDRPGGRPDPTTPRLTLPASLLLPRFDPFKQLEERLGILAGVDQNDAAFLRARATELAKQYESLSFPLGYGPIHGDANVGNVILSEDGRPVLIDLDSFATGPREWSYR